jgi:hypothetical protein
MRGLEDRARGLERFGFTPRQARFVATVALHSGYCLRRQYAAFANVAYGKNVRDFLDVLVKRGLAERFSVRADRGHVYHLQSRSIYRVLGQEDNRNRRDASAALMARKIMLLDFALLHRDLEWLVTEEDKLNLFVDILGMRRSDLPQRAYASSAPGVEPTIHFFPHKMPMALVGDPPTARFVYLAADHVGGGFHKFLLDHLVLFQRLQSWVVVAIAPPKLPFATECEAVFGRFLNDAALGVQMPPDDLHWYFATRKTVESGQLRTLSVPDIHRFRELRDKFTGAAIDAAYSDWATRREAGGPADHQVSLAERRSVGRLVVETLPFDYSQFGSLPGIA